MIKGKSPLKDSPLRNPGQSLDEEIRKVINDEAMAPYVAIAGLWAIALFEWVNFALSAPRRPWIFTVLALASSVWFYLHFRRVKERVRTLRQGRDGERTVAEYLDEFRQAGARIFHDIPAPTFNIDHVLISTYGIFVIETKTISKPAPDSKVFFDGEKVAVGNWRADPEPVKQAEAEAKWIGNLLAHSTGRALPTRGVVVYPGWWVEQTHKERTRKVWVLSLKALAGWIEHEPLAISPDDVALAAFHLSRYVRGENRT